MRATGIGPSRRKHYFEFGALMQQKFVSLVKEKEAESTMWATFLVVAVEMTGFLIKISDLFVLVVNKYELFVESTCLRLMEFSFLHVI